MRRIVIIVPTVAAIALALSGCAGDSPAEGTTGSSATAGPSSVGVSPAASAAPPTGSARVHVDDLRAAITGVYPDCVTWSIPPMPAEATTALVCQERMIMLTIYPDGAAARTVIDRSLASAEPQPFLLGVTWTVTIGDPGSEGDELTALQKALGGEIVGP